MLYNDTHCVSVFHLREIGQTMSLVSEQNIFHVYVFNVYWQAVSIVLESIPYDNKVK